MTRHAKGQFDVQTKPDSGPDDPVGRFVLIKHFHGALDATSTGYMLAIRGEATGSAGYVAMERVTGVLDGRKGSFALQHNGIMIRSVPTLNITIVPDSGTDELKGISGALGIVVADGVHSYDLAYDIAPA